MNSHRVVGPAEGFIVEENVGFSTEDLLGYEWATNGASKTAVMETRQADMKCSGLVVLPRIR